MLILTVPNTDFSISYKTGVRIGNHEELQKMVISKELLKNLSESMIEKYGLSKMESEWYKNYSEMFKILEERQDENE